MDQTYRLFRYIRVDNPRFERFLIKNKRPRVASLVLTKEASVLWSLKQNPNFFCHGLHTKRTQKTGLYAHPCSKILLAAEIRKNDVSVSTEPTKAENLLVDRFSVVSEMSQVVGLISGEGRIKKNEESTFYG